MCAALARPDSLPSVWSTLPADAGWLALDPEVRMRHALSWGRTLHGGSAHVAFDALAGWPELADAEAIAPAWDAEWALLRAQRWRSRPSQARAASLHAELAARRILTRLRGNPSYRMPWLRAELLALTGAHRPAYHALAEADSLLWQTGGGPGPHRFV